MSTLAGRPRRFPAAALAALLVLGGCSVAAEPATPGPLATLDIPATPTPPPTQRPTPSPVATPSPTPAASPTKVPEPETELLVAKLRIGAPYELVANPGNKALTASFSIDVAGTHIDAIMHGREIRRGRTVVGVAFVMEVSGMKLTRQTFEAEANATGRATFSTILGQRVAFVTTQTKVGMYLLHGNIVMVAAVDPADTEALLTSVIEANLGLA